MDFTLFANGPMFGCREDVLSFFSSPDSGRKEILEKLLGLELYTEAQKVAAAEIKTIAGKLDDAEMERTELQTKVAERSAALLAIQTSPRVEDLQFKINRQTVVVKRLVRSEARYKAELEVAYKALVEEEEKAQDRQRAYDAELDKWTVEFKRLKALVHGSEQAHARAEGHRTTLLATRERWEKLDGKVCDMCQQPVEAKHVAEATRRIDSEMMQVGADLDQIACHLGEESENLGAHERQRPQPPVFRLYDAETVVVRNSEAAVANCVARRKQAEADLAALHAQNQDFEAHANAVRGELEEAQARLAVVEADWLLLRKRCDMLQFWVEGFGNGGVKSLLIEAELPEINRLATGYAQRLFGPGARIGINATRELKKGAVREELGIYVVVPGCTQSYAGASKGQKHRLDLCLILAFRDILGSRSLKAFRQLFADELFDGLDKVGCKFIVELLKEIAATVPVCMITHDPLLKTAADHVVVVHHTAGAASLLAHHARPAITTEGNPRKVQRGGRSEKG
jgi:DNA repair exonuclease SbcCD ATPase subunit